MGGVVSTIRGMADTANTVNVQIALITLVASAVVYKVVRKLTSSKKPSPPGPWGFPIVGHLPLLGKEPSVTFLGMREKFGDIFQIRMGSWTTIVVSGKRTIIEVLQDDDFANRPLFESYKILGSAIFGNYTEASILNRKIEHKALFNFSNARKNPIEDMIQNEVNILLDTLTSGPKNIVDPNESVYLSVASIIYQICFGRDQQIRENKEFVFFIKTHEEFSKFIGAGNPVDVMPWLQYLMPWKIRRFADFVATGTSLTNKKVAEHKETFSNDNIRDVTDSLLAACDNVTTLSQEDILSKISGLFAAGYDTVASTLLWAIQLMASHREVQKRVQAEIDEVIGNGRWPGIYDRDRLVYTEAVLHEVNRFVSLSPLAPPHSTTRDTELGGYSIKKDTVVLINLFSMSRDKDVWGDPDVFRPERFLDESGQIRKDLLKEFLPFSFGNRKCIGESLAKVELFLYFTGLLQRCSFRKPPGVTEYSTDVVLGLGRQCLPYSVHIELRN